MREAGSAECRHVNSNEDIFSLLTEGSSLLMAPYVPPLSPASVSRGRIRGCLTSGFIKKEFGDMDDGYKIYIIQYFLSKLIL